MFNYILLCIFAYLFGSINFARVASFLWKKPIPEGENPGATTVFRRISKPAGVFTAFFDVLKGVLPVFFYQWYFTKTLFSAPFFIFFVGAFAILGHCWPLYFRFKGGRGGATACGIMFWVVLKTLPLFWLVILLMIYLYFVFVLKMSLGLIGVIMLPLVMVLIFFAYDLRIFYQYFLGIALIALLLIIRNRDQMQNFWKKK